MATEAELLGRSSAAALAQQQPFYHIRPGRPREEGCESGGASFALMLGQLAGCDIGGQSVLSCGRSMRTETRMSEEDRGDMSG